MKFKVIPCVSAMAVALMIMIPGVFAQDMAQKETAPAAETKTMTSEEMDKATEGLSLVDMLNIKISTASKFPQKIKDIPASVVVVTREDIRRYGYQSVQEIMENIPGIYSMGKNEDSVPMYGVRGFVSPGPFATMSVMINGVIQKDFYESPSLLMDVPVGAIDQVEVVRGPMSVIYGSGAFFGAINIITDDRYNDSPVKMVSASAGNLNTYKGFARFGGVEGDLSYTLNAGFARDDGPQVSYSDMSTGNQYAGANYPLFSNIDTVITESGNRLRYENKEASLFAAYKGLTADIRMLKRENQTMWNIIGDEPLKPRTVSSSTVQLGYDTDITPWLSLSAKAMYQNYSQTLRNELFYKYYISSQQADFETWHAEVNAILKPRKDMDIIVGINRSTIEDLQNSLDFPFLPSTSNANFFVEPVKSWGIFTQADWKPLDRLRVIGGVRFERTEDYGLTWSWSSDKAVEPPTVVQGKFSQENEWEILPRLALLYDISSNHILKLMYGTATKRPSPRMVAFGILENSEILSEKMSTYELNYIGSLTRNLTANVSVFRNEADHLVCNSAVYETYHWSSVSANTGEIITHGIEMSFQAKPTAQLLLDAGVVIQKTEDKRSGWEDIEPWGSPGLLGYFRASYKFPKNITLGATVRYVDQMEAEWSSASMENGVPKASTDDPLNGRMGYPADAYWLVSLNLRADKLFNTGFFATANISNLFDNLIMYPVNSSSYVSSFIDKGTPEYGRRWLLTVGYEW